MMAPIIMDQDFNLVGVIDAYDSLIWTERYDRAGDFELQIAATPQTIGMLQIDYYLYLEESEKVMIIEAIRLTTDFERGNYLKVTGRSLEAILERRIVWDQTTLDGYLQGQIRKLLNDNIISPSDSERAISNFKMENSTDVVITQTQINSQYTGDNIFTVICSICRDLGLGFKVTLSSLNEFVFKLYNGVDRSYNQDENNYVVFSPNFDNLINSEFVDNKVSYRTIGLIAGEGEGAERIKVPVAATHDTGLERREVFIDARDIQSDEEMELEEYLAILAQRGFEKMSDMKELNEFSGSMDTTLSFKYGRDFFLGDIVQVENEYGIQATCRVTELIRSLNGKGYLEYPTFEMI